MAIFILVGVSIIFGFVTPFLERTRGRPSKELLELHITYELILPLQYPFQINNWFLYAVVNIVQSYSHFLLGYIYGIGLYLFIITSLDFLRVIHNLISSIKNINFLAELLYLEQVKRKSNRRKMNLQLCISSTLKKIIKQHQNLKRLQILARDISDALLGLAFFFLMLSIGVSFKAFAKGSEFTLTGKLVQVYISTAIEVLGILMPCILGQVIIDMSEDIKMMLYFADWYKWHRFVVRDVLIFQEASKIHFELKYFGLFTCSLATFTDIMNCSYKFYSLLRIS
uniref:Odorant receptor n=1 Tax=Yemma signatus TaxID=300820 RepID=A0A385H5P3_9HEMI|nr:odorant receptor [Yemma signatus]